MPDLQYSFLVRSRGRKNYQLILSYKGRDGKWHQKSKGGYVKASMASLESEKAKLLAAVKGLMTVERGHETITLSDFLEIYADDRKIRLNSKRSYLSAVKILGDVAEKPMKDITLGDVKGRLVASDAQITTKNLFITVLRSLFNSACEDYAFIPYNPLKKLKRYKSNAVSAGYRILSDEEVQLLLDKSRDDPEYYLMVALGAFAGLRIGEILGLTLPDIDLSGGTITVNKQWDIAHKAHGFIPAKTNNSNRTIPIPPKLISILRHYLSLQKVVSMSGRLFLATNACGFRRWMRGIMPGKSPHALRHTYITNLIAHGMDIKTVAALAGDTPVTILNHYVHYTERMREKAKEDVQRIFG